MEDNKVALSRKGRENNRIIATLKDVKSLLGILIGSIEVCGLDCVKVGDEVDENAKVFLKQKGKEGLCGILIPLSDISIETIAELAVDKSETFGCGEAIDEGFSESVGDII